MELIPDYSCLHSCGELVLPDIPSGATSVGAPLGEILCLDNKLK